MSRNATSEETENTRSMLDVNDTNMNITKGMADLSVTTSALLNLPPELRIKTYSYLINPCRRTTPGWQCVKQYECFSNPWRHLFQTCKQINHELVYEWKTRGTLRVVFDENGLALPFTYDQEEKEELEFMPAHDLPVMCLRFSFVVIQLQTHCRCCTDDWWELEDLEMLRKKVEYVIQRRLMLAQLETASTDDPPWLRVEWKDMHLNKYEGHCMRACNASRIYDRRGCPVDMFRWCKTLQQADEWLDTQIKYDQRGPCKDPGSGGYLYQRIDGTWTDGAGVYKRIGDHEHKYLYKLYGSDRI